MSKMAIAVDSVTPRVDILELSQIHDNILQTAGVEFMERVNRLHGFLTAFNVLPTKRASQFGELHHTFCAVLLIIHDKYDGQFSLSIRTLSELTKLPIGSGLVSYLDEMVAATLLDRDGGDYQFLHVLKQACRHLTIEEVISA